MFTEILNRYALSTKHRKRSRRNICLCMGFIDSLLHNPHHSCTFTCIPGGWESFYVRFCWLYNWHHCWSNTWGVLYPFTWPEVYRGRLSLPCFEKAGRTWAEGWRVTGKAYPDAIRERGVAGCCCLSCGCIRSGAYSYKKGSNCFDTIFSYGAWKFLRKCLLPI